MSSRLAPAVLFTLLAAGEAWARAGGGGNFGGGGGGGGGGGLGGGGSFGGGGDLDGFAFLLALAFRYPLIGVPLLLVAMVVFFVGSREGRSRYQGRVIRKARRRRRVRVDRDVAKLVRAGDPGFSERGFLGRVVPAFRLLQQAWCDQDLVPVRPFVSDGIHERFQLQLAEQRELGYRDRMERLEVEGASLEQYFVEGPLEVLTVCIEASAVDHRVRLDDGSHVSGSRSAEPFLEYWTFVRRKGARTEPGKPGLLEGNCPNCGAGVLHNQWAQCEHCQALLRSGEHDWVLAEITQAGEWRAREPHDVSGLGQVRARDPELSVQTVEDRASVLFWRWSMAARTGSLGSVRGVVTERARAQIEEEIGASEAGAGLRSYVGERGVGAVDVLGFAAEEDQDRALVAVRWSGTTFVVATDGGRERLRPTDVMTTWFELVRKAGGASGFDAGLSSAHCSGCGAPQSLTREDDTGAACDYCGESLVDGNHGWLLDRLLVPWSREAKELRASLGRSGSGGLRKSAAPPPDPGEPPRSGVLSWMAQVARSDGTVGEKEREALHAVGRRIGVRGGQVEELIEDRAAHAAPRDGKEAREWLALAARVAYADGRLDATERELLLRMGRDHGLVKADVRVLLNQARAELYQRAKRELDR